MDTIQTFHVQKKPSNDWFKPREKDCYHRNGSQVLAVPGTSKRHPTATDSQGSMDSRHAWTKAGTTTSQFTATGSRGLMDTRPLWTTTTRKATVCTGCRRYSNNNNNNNNRIQRRYSRFFTISSQRRELSPTPTLKWPGRNRVQIACNTSSAYHVQVSCDVPLGTK